MNWTQQQQRAIEDRGNLLISAAAGSGKTAVLTERIVRLVRDGTSISRLLVVTYTKAAAAEMKKRIAKRLAEAAQADELHAPQLCAAACEVGRANISTLHSFCAQVLRRHFHEAGLDPAFRICDEAQGELLREDALNELMEDRYSSDPAFAELVQRTGDDERFGNIINGLFNFMFAQEQPFAWLEYAVQRYTLDADGLARSPEVELLVRSAKTQLCALLDAYRAIRDEIADAYPTAAAVMDDDAAQLRAVCIRQSYADYGAALESVEFKRLTFPRGTPDECKAVVADPRDRLKKLVRQQQSAFARTLAQEAAQLADMYPHMLELADVMRDFVARYDMLKRAASVIDYQDMEHMTLRLLNDPSIAAEYRERFEHIFVDEYQDANRVQERILSLIKRNDNLFLVGDVKQSIYRFRMAEPGLFLEKYHAYDGTNGTRIDLNANFRSTDEVIEAVNAVFSRIMSREAGELDYDDAAALTAGRGVKGGVELNIIGGSNASSDEEDTTIFEDAEAEAMLAAQRIHELMDGSLCADPSTGEMRPYRYCDFAILGRSVKAVAERWARTLSLCGIPAYADITGGYFSAVEIRLLMDILRIIDNRRQDIPLAAVLRSPIGGLDTDELIALRSGTDADFFDSLTAAAQKDTPLGAKVKRILARLDEWQEASCLISIEQLICNIIDETGYYEYVSALPGSARRANLDAFVERARSYESGVMGLHGFIGFMERIKNTDTLGSAQTAGADVVRILSIHRSKGLEFPVVLLAGLGKRFNREDAKQSLLTDSLGIGARHTLENRNIGTLFRDAILYKKQMEDLAEEMRVLYVGMTRAQNRLIMIGSSRDVANLVRRCALPPTPALITRSNSPLELVLLALMDTQSGNALRAELKLGARNTPLAVPINICAATATDLFCPHIPERQYRAFTSSAAIVQSGYADEFKWEYPFIEDTLIPGKLSVSRLLGNAIDMCEHPDFIIAPLHAADSGTAAHILMQHITLAAHSVQSVRDQLGILTGSGIMTKEQAAAVYAPAIVRFFASALGQRLICAKRVERELEFNVRLSARVLLGAPTDETVLLQGVIDCCFLEENSWTLIDYKTDFVVSGGAEQAAQRHRRQLELYAMALTQLTGQPVAHKYIHFLGTGESIAL
ncbi:MAG: helicase-exonuclease AddAB subunit AddA [Clostridia bacterium]